jgi:hypothetical protein
MREREDLSMSYYEPLTVVSEIEFSDGRVFYSVRVIRQSLNAGRMHIWRRAAKLGSVKTVSTVTLRSYLERGI